MCNGHGVSVESVIISAMDSPDSPAERYLLLSLWLS